MYARLQERRLGGAVLPKPRRAPQPPPPPHSPQSACPRPPPSPAPPPSHHHRAHHSRGGLGRTRRIPAPSGLARALTKPPVRAAAEGNRCHAQEFPVRRQRRRR